MLRGPPRGASRPTSPSGLGSWPGTGGGDPGAGRRSDRGACARCAAPGRAAGPPAGACSRGSPVDARRGRSAGGRGLPGADRPGPGRRRVPAARRRWRSGAARPMRWPAAALPRRGPDRARAPRARSSRSPPTSSEAEVLAAVDGDVQRGGRRCGGTTRSQRPPRARTVQPVGRAGAVVGGRPGRRPVPRRPPPCSTGCARDRGRSLRWTPEARALQGRLQFLHGWAPRRLARRVRRALLATLDDWLGPLLPGATGRRDLERVDLRPGPARPARRTTPAGSSTGSRPRRSPRPTGVRSPSTTTTARLGRRPGSSSCSGSPSTRRWRGGAVPGGARAAVAGGPADPGDRRPARLLARLVGRGPQGHGRPLPEAPVARRPVHGDPAAAPALPLTWTNVRQHRRITPTHG